MGYEHLLWLEEQGIETYAPEGAKKAYRVQDLLNGIEAPEKRRQERERRGREGEWGPPSREPVREEPERRGPVDVRTFLTVGGFVVLAIVVLSGVLGGLVYMFGERAGAAIGSGVLLFFVLLVVSIGVFTGKFGEKTAERIIGWILEKIPVLRGGAGAD